MSSWTRNPATERSPAADTDTKTQGPGSAPYRLRQYGDIIFSIFVPEFVLTETRLPWHTLILVQSGELRAETASGQACIKAGQMVFIRRSCRLKILKQACEGHPYQAISLRLQRPLLRAVLRSHKEQTQPQSSLLQHAVSGAAVPDLLALPPDPYLLSLFASLQPLTETDLAPEPELCESKIAEAVRCLLRLHPELSGALFDFSSPWKIDLKAFMEENFTQSLTISEFASYCGRSLAAFKRDFSALYQQSPERWLTERRLQRARDLLSRGKGTASDIYLQVGFKNRTHFARIFHQRFGITPREAMPQAN